MTSVTVNDLKFFLEEQLKRGVIQETTPVMLDSKPNYLDVISVGTRDIKSPNKRVKNSFRAVILKLS